MRANPIHNKTRTSWQGDCIDRAMPIARITGQGLIWIAALVTVLWGCILMEATTIRRARIDAQRSLHELRVLRYKLQAEPASLPIPRRSLKPAAG